MKLPRAIISYFNILYSVFDILKEYFTMKIMFFLIILSLVVAGGFLMAFIWATKSGQFDDDYTPSVRMLFDDEKRVESRE